ncbi:helix-turn-helix domain-containing protein [Flavobacterium chilense]|uniref:DNA-binding transcriptional regulator, XRE-family HTH domain n=1 Tax=Flavobacterium chilense TaxID=946677 RepID=A0A1M7DPK2_9FLAO|nr:helix-turn-helix transcriptional regulator [Flavobacterium chilense]SHL81395.1 DNA-binding transcriptional regulator, XRE-family HTH domain [Flavobacterium chilense]
MDKKDVNLKQIRESQRLTQSEFGEILGVSRSTITKIEAGEVKLSKKMILKLQNSFPKEMGLPYEKSGLIGNENESDILITIIATNLGRIDQVKDLIKAMCINTDYTYDEDKFLQQFLRTSDRLNLNENNILFSKSIKYEYRFLIDFLNITKECLFSIYEDLYNFTSVKYHYSK